MVFWHNRIPIQVLLHIIFPCRRGAEKSGPQKRNRSGAAVEAGYKRGHLMEWEYMQRIKIK